MKTAGWCLDFISHFASLQRAVAARVAEHAFNPLPDRRPGGTTRSAASNTACVWRGVPVPMVSAMSIMSQPRSAKRWTTSATAAGDTSPW